MGKVNNEPDSAAALREMAAQRASRGTFRRLYLLAWHILWPWEVRWPVYCAWCLPAGRKTIVAWSTCRGSHGICRQCNERARAQSGLPPLQSPTGEKG